MAAPKFEWQTTRNSRGRNRPDFKIEARVASGFSKGWHVTYYVRYGWRDSAEADLLACGEFDKLYTYSPGDKYCPKCNESHACRECWTLWHEVTPAASYDEAMAAVQR